MTICISSSFGQLPGSPRHLSGELSISGNLPIASMVSWKYLAAWHSSVSSPKPHGKNWPWPLNPGLPSHLPTASQGVRSVLQGIRVLKDARRIEKSPRHRRSPVSMLQFWSSMIWMKFPPMTSKTTISILWKMMNGSLPNSVPVHAQPFITSHLTPRLEMVHIWCIY